MTGYEHGGVMGFLCIFNKFLYSCAVCRVERAIVLRCEQVLDSKYSGRQCEKLKCLLSDPRLQRTHNSISARRNPLKVGIYIHCL